MSKKETDESDELDTERDDSDSVDDAADADAADDAARASDSDDEDDDDDGGSDDDASDDGDDENVDAAEDSGAAAMVATTPTEESEAPAHLGAAQKYVHAAFFAAGILGAYLSGKIIQSAWNELAEWPTAVRAVPALLRFAEDDRANYSLMAGALIGIIAVIQTYRKEKIRQWANDVAGELAKVTWPTKDIVTNGTVVVVIATIISTTYIGLLDRLWGFLTNLVYGA
ncbi:MAG TPA: preprotein translocase subunit SecE [Polyangiaceae bacterium]|nr:preprotein translocase subunit SecE [Polyangiaceae bacterium]